MLAQDTNTCWKLENFSKTVLKEKQNTTSHMLPAARALEGMSFDLGRP
jgi:hypothetical protein